MKKDQNYPAAKREVKNSVFLELFKEPENILSLCRALNIDVTGVTADDLEIITLKNILTDAIYNDLGFKIKGRLVVLVEAQSTWSPNILPRSLMYLGETYRRELEASETSPYSSKKVHLSRAEMHVIYTGVGHEEEHGQTRTLTELFFGGIPCSIEGTVKIWCKIVGNDIVSQYIRFCRILDEQVRSMGRNTQAITKTLEICEKENVLSDFLQSRRMEVYSMMDFLFSQEKAVDAYAAEKAAAAEEEAAAEAAIKNFIDGLVTCDVSDFEVAVTKVMKQFSLSEEEARDTVRKHDAFSV